MGAADDFEVVVKIAGVGEERGDGFGGIEGAAAAETDDEIAGVGAGVSDGAGDVVGRRFVGDRNGGGGELSGGEEVKEGLGAGRIAAGDDEGAVAEFARERADLFQGAGAEDDPGGGGEFEGHYQVPAGWRLVNLVLVRGEAIIGATVSRHAA